MLLRTSIVSFAALTAFGLGCTTPSDETAEDQAPIATSSATTACSDVATTDDGGGAIYARCSGAGGAIVRLDISRGTERYIAGYIASDRILKVGTKGNYIYWATRHADGSRDLSIVELRDSASTSTVSEPTTIPLGEVSEPFGDVVLTTRGLVALIGRVVGTNGHAFFVGRFGSPAPLFNLPLEVGSFHLWLSRNENAIAIVNSSRSWRVLDRLPLMPMLRDEVRVPFSLANTLPDTFDGSSFVARIRTAEGDMPIVGIDARTGAYRTFSTGFSAGGSLFASDTYVWQTARRSGLSGRWTLERMRRNSADAPLTIATDDEEIEARPSRDGSGIVFRAGTDWAMRPSMLAVAPADASLPAKTVIAKADNLEVSFGDDRWAPKPRGTGANRQLVWVRDIATRAQTVRLFDEIGGATLGSWKAGADFDDRRDLELGANGASVFVPRSCNDVGPGPRGTMMVQLWPAAVPVTGCVTLSFGQRVELPNSAALLFTRNEGDRRTLTIVRP